MAALRDILSRDDETAIAALTKQFKAEKAERIAFCREAVEAVLPEELRSLFDIRYFILPCSRAEWDNCKRERASSEPWAELVIEEEGEEYRLFATAGTGRNSAHALLIRREGQPAATIAEGLSTPAKARIIARELDSLRAERTGQKRQAEERAQYEANQREYDRRRGIHALAEERAKRRADLDFRAKHTCALAAQTERAERARKVLDWPEGTTVKLWKVEWMAGVNGEGAQEWRTMYVKSPHFALTESSNPNFPHHFDYLTIGGWEPAILVSPNGYIATPVVWHNTGELPQSWMRRGITVAPPDPEVKAVAEEPCACGQHHCNGVVTSQHSDRVPAIDFTAPHPVIYELLTGKRPPDLADLEAQEGYAWD